jgi:transcriptional regulator with XRE-family HTH domain
MATTQRRRQPKKLARKLLTIREELGLSQSEMARRLELDQAYTVISAYELGTDEPDLVTLLGYAKAGRTTIDRLVDDELDLPLK